MSRLIHVVLFLFLLAGCVAKPGVRTGGGTNPQDLRVPRWILSSLVVDGLETPLSSPQQTIQFTQGGSVSGDAACNSFSGSYQAGDNGAISLSNMVSTMRACQAMDQESAYLNALSQVRNFRLEGGALILTSASAKTTLTFQRPAK